MNLNDSELMIPRGHDIKAGLLFTLAPGHMIHH